MQGDHLNFQHYLRAVKMKQSQIHLLLAILASWLFGYTDGPYDFISRIRVWTHMRNDCLLSSPITVASIMRYTFRKNSFVGVFRWRFFFLSIFSLSPHYHRGSIVGFIYTYNCCCVAVFSGFILIMAFNRAYVLGDVLLNSREKTNFAD